VDRAAVRDVPPVRRAVRVLIDTKGLVDTYRLLEEGLHAANVRHEERSALLLGAIDRAGGDPYPDNSAKADSPGRSASGSISSANP
jgi:hypothetical protein